MKLLPAISSKILARAVSKAVLRLGAVLLLLLTCFAMVLPPQGLCAEVRRTVRVGYYIAPGFQDYDASTGEYSGSSYEYMMAIKQYVNWEYVFVPVHFSEGVRMLEAGELDLLNNVSHTPEREKTLLFSTYPSGSNYGALIVDAQNRTYAYNDYQAFSKLRIGMLATSIYKPYFAAFCQQYGIKPQLTYYPKDADMTAAVKAGAIDARVVSSSYRDGSRIIAKFAPLNYFFAVPASKPDLLRDLNKAMEDIRTDMPELEQELEKKYASHSVEKMVVLSEAEQRFVQKQGVVKVAAVGALYPLCYFDEQGKFAGIMAQIYQKIGDATGLKFDFIKYKHYEEAWKAVRAGKADVMAQFPYDFVFADQWKLQLSDRVGKAAVYRVVNSNKFQDKVNSVALYGEAYIEGKLRDHYGAGVKFVQYPSLQAAMEAVLAGEVDATFVNEYSNLQFQGKGHYLALQSIPITNLEYSYTFGIGEGADPALKTLLAKALHTISPETMEAMFMQVEKEYATLDLEAQFYQNPRLALLLIAICAGIAVLLVSFFIYSRNIHRKNLELENAQKAQSDFLSRMSHDMRTPMNGLMGISYLMAKENSLEGMRNYVPQLQETGRYLLQLINDVLDVNKISSGNMTLNTKVCDEQKVFENIVSMLQPSMDAKNIEFAVQKINIDWKYMLLDEQRVKQIFVNLLNNAVKFTPPGGKIELKMEAVKETEKYVLNRFTISDNGIGISPEFLPYIFEPFKQERRERVDNTTGTGLGLAIVKKLVELMQGSISVTSRVNEGTRFVVDLQFPLAEAPAVVEEQPEAAATASAEHKETQLIHQKLRVLLCEDHPLNALIARKLLEQEGAIVTWAEDGQQGVQLFTQSELHSFDLILMDIRMPVLDGLATARKIRAMEREDASTVPIIAMSANAYPEDVTASLEAGMNAHLAKPVAPALLYATINKYVK